MTKDIAKECMNLQLVIDVLVEIGLTPDNMAAGLRICLILV